MAMNAAPRLVPNAGTYLGLSKYRSLVQIFVHSRMGHNFSQLRAPQEKTLNINHTFHPQHRRTVPQGQTNWTSNHSMSSSDRAPLHEQIRAILTAMLELVPSQDQQSKERQMGDGHRCKDHCGHHKTTRPHNIYGGVKFSGPGCHWDASGMNCSDSDDTGEVGGSRRAKRCSCK